MSRGNKPAADTTQSGSSIGTLRKRGSKLASRSRSPIGRSFVNGNGNGNGTAKGNGVADGEASADVHQELERLREKYATLLQKHRELRKETSELKDVAILPHVWTPYIKFMFLWAITALILFALGMCHHLVSSFWMNSSKVNVFVDVRM